MKKTIIYLAITLFTVSYTFGQEFNLGTNVINGGIGFGSTLGNFSTSSESPTYSISYERGMWEVPGPGVVSLGAFLGTKSYKYKYFGGNDKWTYTIIGVRGAYHYNGLEIDNLDVYAGALVSYNILSFDGNSGNFGSDPGVTGFVGGRWFFTDSIAVFAEGSYGIAFLTIGASFRF